MICQMFKRRLKEQFKKKKWLFTDAKPELFLMFNTTKEDFNPLYYVIYRWIWGIYHLCVWAYTFSQTKHYGYYWIFLTNHTYIILTVLNTYWAVLVTYHYMQTNRGNKQSGKMTLSFKILWILIEISGVSSFLITAAYWKVIYTPEKPINASNALKHIFNSVYMLLEILISGMPINILHFYVPFGYCITYTFFTLIYYWAGATSEDGGHAIYPIMDWENLGLSLPFLIGNGVCSPLMQFIVWFIKEMAYTCCLGKYSKPENYVATDIHRESVNHTMDGLQQTNDILMGSPQQEVENKAVGVRISDVV